MDNGLKKYNMKKKIIRITENDIYSIVKKVVNEASLSYEKKKITNMLYKKTQSLTSRFYSDESWQGVNMILDVIENAIGSNGELKVWCENGGYWKRLGEFPNYKEYKINIMMNNGVEINGSIKCHSAGTMEDTFSRYDMTLTLW